VTETSGTAVVAMPSPTAGADVLVRSLANAGASVWFANPGTTELRIVSALDRLAEARPVLCLFEGVATGAADGFARMAGRPAVALLHLGPGLANGLANLHNARRAETPVVAVVGDHPRQHKRLDPPLESDIDALAGTVSGWVRRSLNADAIAADAVAAVGAALGPPGRVATLICPADVLWSETAPPPRQPPLSPAAPRRVDAALVEEAARQLREGAPAALLLGGSALRAPGLRAAAAAAAVSHARLLSETFPARLERGGGLPRTEPLAYGLEMAAGQLEGLRTLILAGARSPVAFFAQPGMPGSPLPEECAVHALASDGDDAVAALEVLADLLGATAPGSSNVHRDVDRRRPTGELTAVSAAEAVGALLPEGAILVDESVTNRIFMFSETAASPRHDYLTLTGGAIGEGLPLAVGAAIAAPERRVVALQADGSALYTLQALWSMAREALDVTILLLSNRRYAILAAELHRIATEVGDRAGSLIDIDRPELSFRRLAEGMGVDACAVATADDLGAQLERSLAEPGPHLIEARVPSLFR
jgi:acetolactate synthase-1/2/3 large subunit